MEEPIISTTEEGENEPQLSEDHAHRVFRHRGIVHREFVPQGQNVDTKFYYEVLRYMRENIGERDRNCGVRRVGFSTTTMHPVTEHSSFVSFSPTTTCYRFFLYPKMKMQLKGRRFHTVAEIQRESQTTTHT
jgi:hypothetical protein